MLNNNNERELAYVVSVTDVFPMDADRLERVMINGWAVVCAKGEFNKGDLGVFFEIDSMLPEIPPFSDIDFLRSKHYKIKSQKIRGVVSQGLLLPLSYFNFNHELKEGDFLTKELGVTYYIPEDNKRKSNPVIKDKYKRMAASHANLFKLAPFRWLMKRQWGKDLLFVFFGHTKYNPLQFPTQFPYIHKTDEERIENIPWILTEKDSNGNKSAWIKTTKVDGTSSTYILERKKFHKFEFYVTSRNVRQINENQLNYHNTNSSSQTNVYWDMAEKYHIKEVLLDILEKEKDLDYVCLQGEIAGPNVQGNPHKLERVRFFAFNYIDSKRGRWNSVEAKNLFEKYDIEWVPIIDTNYILPDDLEEFKLSADGVCEVDGSSGLREGYVYRSIDGKRSFKNVSRKYLLKYQGD